MNWRTKILLILLALGLVAGCSSKPEENKPLPGDYEDSRKPPGQ